MRRIEGVIETGIYADDLEQAEQFYRDILGLEPVAVEAGRHVFFRVGEGSMLLIFQPDSTLKGDHLPAHGRAGRATSRSAFPPPTSMNGAPTSSGAAYPSSMRSPGRGAAIPSTSAIPRATSSSCSRPGSGGCHRDGRLEVDLVGRPIMAAEQPLTFCLPSGIIRERS